MSDVKLYQKSALALGASDLIYASRADGSADGNADLTALSAIVHGVNGALYDPAGTSAALAASLAAVATTADYADLTGVPSLATVATTGAYADLTGTPTLASVATTGAYSDLTGAPSLGYFATGTDASNLTGTISVNRFNSGSGASSSTFLRGDGTWATPGGGGTVTTSGSPASGNLAKFSSATAITNGDLSGDVTTSGTLAATIANDVVTYAKMQNVSAASKLLGRGDSGSGDPQEITLGTGLSMSGTTLSAPGRLTSVTTTTGTPANTNETDLLSYTLPAGTLAVDGQAVRIRAAGTLAGVSRTRTLRLYLGTTKIADGGSANSANVFWEIDAIIIRVDATNQRVITNLKFATTTGSGITVLVSSSTETLANALSMKVTGQSSGTPVANDLVGNLYIAEFLP